MEIDTKIILLRIQPAHKLFEFEVLGGLFGVAIDTDFTWLVIMWRPFKLKDKRNEAEKF